MSVVAVTLNFNDCSCWPWKKNGEEADRELKPEKMTSLRSDDYKLAKAALRHYREEGTKKNGYKKKEDIALQQFLKQVDLYREFVRMTGSDPTDDPLDRRTSQRTLDERVSDSPVHEEVRSGLRKSHVIQDLFTSLPKVEDSDSHQISRFKSKKITKDLEKVPLENPLNKKEIKEILQAIKSKLKSEDIEKVSNTILTQMIVEELKKRGRRINAPDIDLDAVKRLPKDVKKLTREDRELIMANRLSSLLKEAGIVSEELVQSPRKRVSENSPEFTFKAQKNDQSLDIIAESYEPKRAESPVNHISFITPRDHLKPLFEASIEKIDHLECEVTEV
ncbi:MAG: hypothetical protein WCG42_02725 [Parachlamydiaceae bacterium]